MSALIPSFYNTLLATQAADPAKFRAYQYGLLAKLLRHARANVPFYRDSGRLDPVFMADGSIDLSRWEEIPVLTRTEASDHAAALTTEQVPAEMRPLRSECTSGSTGQPLMFLWSELSRVASAASFARALHWHGALPVGRFAVLRSPNRRGPPDRQAEGDDIDARRYSSAGPLLVSTDTPPADQAATLREHGVTHVIGRTHALLAIAEAAGKPFRGIRLVFQTGEMLPDDKRASISAAFGTPVVDTYSTSEIGPIAIEGPDGGLRISEESVYLDWPEKAGAIGAPHELIATPLYAYGTPLIRYAPGDFVRFSERTSPDAPTLRQIETVVGRKRSLFRRADGTRFSPSISGWRMNEIVQMRKWRLTQDSFDTAYLEVVCDRPLERRQAAALSALLEEATRFHPVSVRRVESLPDERPSGKAFELCRCLVE